MSDNPIAWYALRDIPPVPVDQEALINQVANERPVPLDRDDNEIPEDIDEDGDDNNDGDVQWVLVTSFDEKEAKSGKVWVVPNDDNDEGFTLISGLTKPNAVCFDVNHEFLYVSDAVDDKNGILY
jgi:sugar lactone lactonase YvrE